MRWLWIFLALLCGGVVIAETYVGGKALALNRFAREKLPEAIESSCVLNHIYDVDDGTNFYDYSTSQNDGTSSTSTE